MNITDTILLISFVLRMKNQRRAQSVDFPFEYNYCNIVLSANKVYSFECIKIVHSKLQRNLNKC